MQESIVDDAPQDAENEINLTPMLDVVFIMLIFFIVTASFIKETGIDVSRPNAPPAVISSDANILITIDKKMRNLDGQAAD
jgi:biopolymer transport protein ExbD